MQPSNSGNTLLFEGESLVHELYRTIETARKAKGEVWLFVEIDSVAEGARFYVTGRVLENAPARISLELPWERTGRETSYEILREGNTWQLVSSTDKKPRPVQAIFLHTPPRKRK